jgi:hypothetical protein
MSCNGSTGLLNRSLERWSAKKKEVPQRVVPRCINVSWGQQGQQRKEKSYTQSEQETAGGASKWGRQAGRQQPQTMPKAPPSAFHSSRSV